MDSSAEQLLKSIDDLSSMFNHRMAEFEKNCPQPNSKESNTTVKSLAAEYSSFKTFIWKTLNILKSQVELLALSVDRLDTYTRRKVLLFHGIKESQDEDVQKKLLDVLNKQMHLPSVDNNVIESCHRLGSRKEGVRPVLVRFTSMYHRAQVWQSKTSLKGSKITVSEFLTKNRQKIFVAARSHFGVRSCWSMEGNVVILLPDKTRRKIVTIPELQKLIAQYPKGSSGSNSD